MDEPFWKTTELEAMSPAEWESLCDGCGKCCLAKLEDEDTGEIYWTSVGCRLFDAGTCRCTDYDHRLERVADCVRLTPQNVRTITWLPSTCAYRLVAEGQDLYWWHPLVSGSPETVHEAGISMRGRVTANETDLPNRTTILIIARSRALRPGRPVERSPISINASMWGSSELRRVTMRETESCGDVLHRDLTAR